ncbi:MAG TPA: CoA-binding protein [Methylomirabilota bacterium]|nr:CoA-binding protein [Methylomirabilota bacterium]
MKTVAVIGANKDRSRWSNKAVRAYLSQGYKVYPVNPGEVSVEGLQTLKSVADIPEPLSIISVYLRPSLTLKLLPEFAAKGCQELWLNPGTCDDAVRAEARRLKLNVIEACSIIGVGVSPASL